MIDLKNASSKEIASYFSHEVNNFCFKPKVAAEELKGSRSYEGFRPLLDKYLIKPRLQDRPAE